MVNNNLNRRKSATVRRENELRTIIDHFCDLFREEKISSAVQTAYNIGMITKVKIVVPQDNDETQKNLEK